MSRETKIEYRPVGVCLQVTPRINPDGKVLLRVESRLSSVSPTPVDLGNGIKAQAFSEQALQTAALLQDGNTLILSGGVRKEDGEVRRETLIILTPHRVKAASVLPASHAAPAAPPVMPQPVVMPPVQSTLPVLPAPRR